MKKFTLSVSEPCHEEWGHMTPDEKGRFCAACQKTVVDFANMSDRQLAEFFKRPKGSVCGRFHSDQLGRPIEVPNKRVPWMRYFFQFTWPAFVLFLKSCGQKNEMLGLLQIKESKTTKETPVVMGLLLPKEMVHADTVKLNQTTEPKIMGDVAILSEMDSSPKVMGDTTFVPMPHEHSTTAIDSLVRPTIDMPCQNTADTGYSGTLGLVSVVVVKKEKEFLVTKEKQTPPVETGKVDVILYPNPVMRGQLLTIKTNEKINGRHEILSASGQVLSTQKISLQEKQPFSIEIPSWPAGTYFLRLINEKGLNISTQKFIVQ